MDLMPTDDQDEIVSTVASFLADRIPVVGRGHEHVAVGPEIDPALWRECAELGWLSLGVPEAAGGVGYTLVEEMLLFRELGRGVAPGPFLPTVLAAHLAAATGDSKLTASIAAGDTVVALGTPIGPATIGAIVSAELSIAHIDQAKFVMVCNGAAAALLPADALQIQPIDAVEGSISTGRGHAKGVAATVWCDATTAPIFLYGLVLAAAAATGVAEAALALAVAHAGQRVQFGKPIGVNQAIKHRCADMAVNADGAFSQACYAAVAVRDGVPGAATEAAVAKYVADQAARVNSEGAVQIHGAMGFTTEALPHRFVYRTHLLARCLATRVQLLDAIIDRSTEGARRE